jgi:uncharacterized membrane protein
MLILLQQITWETSLIEALGKIIFEGIPFSIGVALFRSILNGEGFNPSPDKSVGNRNKKPSHSICNHTLLVSLVASVLMLWFFHQLSWGDSWYLENSRLYFFIMLLFFFLVAIAIMERTLALVKKQD